MIKDKIIKTRKKYGWIRVSDIILNNRADSSDRMFCLCMMLWYVPARMILRIFWIVTYIPAMIFRYVDELLK